MSNAITQSELKSKVEAAEGALAQLPQMETYVRHHFQPGCYLRECIMPAGEGGTFVIGHEHQTRHYNIILEGLCLVYADGELSVRKAGDMFVSDPGVRKILWVKEFTRWVTVHPTEKTEVDEIEKDVIIKSKTWLDNQELLEGFIKALPLNEDQGEAEQ